MNLEQNTQEVQQAINCSVSCATRFVSEAFDLTPMPEMLPYSQDNALSDLFFSCFMGEMVVAVMSEIGGDDI